MEDKRSAENLYIIKEQRVKERLNLNSLPVNGIENNPVLEKFVAEGCESFFNYVDWLGLANDPDLVMLPSTNHFYYDAEDLKEVRTVINLRQLNRFKQIREFLHTIHRVVPYKCYFIGFFTESKNQIGFWSDKNKAHDQIPGKVDPVKNGIVSRIPFVNMIYNIIDSRYNRFMTKRAVTLLLEDASLKILDMTELNGLTYFCTQKIKSSSEKL